MPDQTQLVQSIYSAIFNGVGASGSSTAGDSYICLEWPGMPVSSEEYGNPWTASNTSGNQSATQAFSALVDPIPNDSAVYTLSGLGVESVYGLILNATVSTGPATQEFANAQYKYANLIIGSTLDALATYHPAFAQPANWSSPSSSGWTTISLALNSPTPPPPPPPVVQAAITRAVSTQGGSTGWRSVPINVANVRRLAAPIRKFPTIVAQGGGLHPQTAVAMAVAPGVHPLFGAAAVPAAASAHSVSAATTAVSVAALDRTVQTRSVSEVLARSPVSTRTALSPALLARLEKLPNGVILPHPVVPIQPIAAQPVKSTPITSSSLHLNMQCMRVTILREWLDPLLMKLGNWTMEGMPAGSISSGTADGNTGFFPLLPLSFIVIRNVSITGTWSADDKALATQATTAGNAVAFGPLTLSNAAAGESTFDGSTLSVSGMQVVAWMCMPVPKLPPM